MKRRRLVRVQLLLLGVVVVLMIWRVGRGPATPVGMVTLSNLDDGEVAARAFEMDAPAYVFIDAVGSVEEEGSEVPAAYGWIIRRDTRRLVWRQDPLRSEIDRTRMTTRDSVQLEPGAYEVYFTSFGATERSRGGGGTLGLRPHWTNDAKYWSLVLTPAADAGRRVGFENEGWDADATWSSGTIGNRTTKRTRLWVEETAEIRVYSIIELCLRDCDAASITPLGQDAPIWEMTRENTQEAGGMQRNRVFDGMVTLEPGIYEVAVSTDGSHAARAWRANPPYDPLAWGMRVWSDSDKVREYDPWLGPEALISFREVGNDADLEAVFEVSEPARVVVVSTGEVGSGDTVYDYAWLETEGIERVWEMTVDESQPAGGDRTNRVETAFLTLEPGTYKLRYVSDESHAFGDWRRTRPTVPARWGVSLFPLAAQEGGKISVLNEGPREAPVLESADAPGETLGELPDRSRLLFEATSLGNEEEVKGEFQLERKGRVRVVAIGEITDSALYDYGWIQSKEGATVWEMTRRNTQPAGGNDINRIFDGVLELDPGVYTVGFKTDFSHAYGDFGNGDPRDPRGWGIRVFRLTDP